MLAQVPPRTLYGPDTTDMEYCRRPSRGISIPLSQTSRLDSQYDSADSNLSRNSPPIDPDTKTGSQARRRIAVACDRCRKRKIKCSGDPGDGRGCNNCRNSGHHKCQFLRVQSQVIPYQVSPRHQFIPHSIPRASPYPIGPYHTNQYGSLTSGFDYYSQPSNNGIGRTQYPFPSEEENPSYYNVSTTSSPAFMLPNGINYYAPAASPKAWNYSTNARTPQSSMFPDTSPISTMSPSGNSYISSPSASDVSGTFPSVSSVISATTPTLARTLPDPATTRNFNNTLSAAVEPNSDSASLNAAPYRPSSIWNNTDSFSTEGRYRDGTRSNGGSEPQDLGIGYGISASSSAGRAITTSEPGHNVSPPNAYRTTLSSSSELSSDATPTDGYGYSTENSTQRESIGHLSNGDAYTRLQPSDRMATSYGLIHRHENHGYHGNRTGVAEMCSEGGY